MSLKHIVPSVGSLSSAAVAVVIGGRTGLWLVCGLLVLFFALIAILALTGTFGCDTTRRNAQIVLAILLGRDLVADASDTLRMPTTSARRADPRVRP
jgi:hypothetical protein